MKALRIAQAPAAAAALRREIRRSAESRYDHRLHALLLVCQGHSCAAVAAWLGEHPASVQRWVHRFAADSLAGLQEVQRPGRPGRLASPVWAKVVQEVQASPRALGYPQDRWDGKLLARHLRHQHGTLLGLRQCQRLLRRLNRRRRAR